MHRMVVVLYSRDDSRNHVLDSNPNCCFLLDIGMQPRYYYWHRPLVQHLEDSMEYCVAYGCNGCQCSPFVVVDIYCVIVKVGDKLIRHMEIQTMKSYLLPSFIDAPSVPISVSISVSVSFTVISTAVVAMWCGATITIVCAVSFVITISSYTFIKRLLS